MSEHLDHELPAESRAALERHLRWCSNCRRMVQNLSRTVGGLRRLGHAQVPGGGPGAKRTR